jgi:hypothetical protein
VGSPTWPREWENATRETPEWNVSFGTIQLVAPSQAQVGGSLVSPADEIYDEFTHLGFIYDWKRENKCYLQAIYSPEQLGFYSQTEVPPQYDDNRPGGFIRGAERDNLRLRPSRLSRQIITKRCDRALEIFPCLRFGSPVTFFESKMEMRCASRNAFRSTIEFVS